MLTRTHLPAWATRPRPSKPWLSSMHLSGAQHTQLAAYSNTHRRVTYQAQRDPPLPPTPASTASTTPPHLPHLTPSGDAHIISVSAKPSTHRLATATGYAAFSLPGTAAAVAAAQLRKGDALAAARFAGVVAAKSAPALVPLCHPVALTGARVDVELVPADGGGGRGRREGARGAAVGAAAAERDAAAAEAAAGRVVGEGGKPRASRGCGGVRVTATVECVGRTGVEMEALAAVCGALLSVVDVVKGVDRGVAICEVRLLRKEGGRSGVWVAPDLAEPVEDS
jgi:GTP 3',8-cyclase